MTQAKRFFCAALVFLPLVACKRGQLAKPVVVRIDVVDRSGSAASSPVLDRQALTTLVGESLRKSGLFDVQEGASVPASRKGWRCRLEVGAGAEQAAGQGVLHAAAQAQCGPTSGEGSETLTAQALADKPFAAGEGALEPLLRKHAARLVEDTLGLVVKQYRLRTGPIGDLQAALRDKDADVRRMAIRAAALRRAREVTPALADLLDDPQQDIEEMALGALTDIRDPSSVKSITSRARFGNAEGLVKIIDPIATIGGEEARAFLEFVASGHEDPEIRQLAKQALDRMARRQAPPQQ